MTPYHVTLGFFALTGLTFFLHIYWIVAEKRKNKRCRKLTDFIRETAARRADGDGLCFVLAKGQEEPCWCIFVCNISGCIGYHVIGKDSSIQTVLSALLDSGIPVEIRKEFSTPKKIRI